MRFPWSKKRQTSRQNAAGPASPEPATGLRASDNVGSHCDTEGKGEAYFVSLFQGDAEPLVFYLFDAQGEARQALLEISCVEVATDTGELICTEVLTYGVFPAVDPEGDPCWGAILAGKSMGTELWEEARVAFAARAGQARREEKPEESASVSGRRNSWPRPSWRPGLAVSSRAGI